MRTIEKDGDHSDTSLNSETMKKTQDMHTDMNVITIKIPDTDKCRFSTLYR